MDRNVRLLMYFWLSGVALRKESVDRNNDTSNKKRNQPESLSARRAWIEIMDDLEPSNTRKVALRKESVDRNCRYPACCVGLLVALRKESVDRNQKKAVAHKAFDGRSPQGERG